MENAKSLTIMGVWTAAAIFGMKSKKLGYAIGLSLMAFLASIIIADM